MAKKKSFKDALKERLKDVKDERQKKSIAKAVEFSTRNPNCLIMVLDIKTDDMIVAWQGYYLAARLITPLLGRKTGMVKTILLGRKKDHKKIIKYIQLFKEFVGEFLLKMVEHANDRKEFKEAKKKGYKGNYTNFVHQKRSIIGQVKKNKI